MSSTKPMRNDENAPPRTNVKSNTPAEGSRKLIPKSFNSTDTPNSTIAVLADILKLESLHVGSDVMKVLRYKLTSDKFAFEERNAELEKYVQELIEALATEVHLRKEIRTAVEKVQPDIGSFMAQWKDERKLLDQRTEAIKALDAKKREHEGIIKDLRQKAVEHKQLADAENKRHEEVVRQLGDIVRNCKKAKDYEVAVVEEHLATTQTDLRSALKLLEVTKQSAANAREETRGMLEALETQHGAQLEKKAEEARQSELAVQMAFETERESSRRTQEAAVAALKKEVAETQASSAAESTATQLQLRSVTSEFEQLQQLHNGLKTSTSNTDALLSQVRSQLAGEQRSHATLVTESGILNERIGSLEAELGEVRRMTTSSDERQKAQLKDLRGELELSHKATSEQTELATSLQLQLAAAHAEVSEALSRADADSADAASLSDSVQDLRAQLFAASEAAEEHQNVVRNLNSDLEKLTQETAELEQKRRMLEVEFGAYMENNGNSQTQQMETIAQLNKDALTTQSQITALERRVADADAQRREMHNIIQSLKGNIRVMCRIRPGLDDGAVKSPDGCRVTITHAGDTHGWTFDKVFGTGSTQQQVFDEMDGLVQSALDGFKVCLFAYGQTGSGKTYTMQGTEDPAVWGLIPRSLKKIFEDIAKMKKNGWKWTLEVSFLEVYNEALRDLLRDGKPEDSPPLSIQHSDAWGATVVNAKTVKVDSMDQVSSLMAQAARHRAVGSTDMNAASSRSHSMFALYLHGTNVAKQEQLHGALHLVDLAGSERLDKSHAVGDRLKETQHISKSLSCITNVFLAKAKNEKHVPFRDSTLTHLMEPCLSGQGKTLMMVTVGPETDNSHETLCSLRFAGNVSQCNTGGKPKRGASALTAGSTAQSSGEPAPPQNSNEPAQSSSSQSSGKGSGRTFRMRSTSPPPSGKGSGRTFR